MLYALQETINFCENFKNSTDYNLFDIENDDTNKELLYNKMILDKFNTTLDNINIFQNNIAKTDNIDLYEFQKDFVCNTIYNYKMSDLLKITFYQQYEDWDCGISSLGMMMNLDVKKYNDLFKEYYNTKGLSTTKIKTIGKLIDKNFTIKKVNIDTNKLVLTKKAILLLKKDNIQYGHYVYFDGTHIIDSDYENDDFICSVAEISIKYPYCILIGEISDQKTV